MRALNKARKAFLSELSGEFLSEQSEIEEGVKLPD
ncbi:MAG: hypothetical protein US55_C0064G0004 [Candidatus Levybacteria bacterium GW2011_GWC2_37_7]|nr:MAG: hypothetical protein US55_C0064G0004 [Candidatus Levybacteria bacterium GW2011_GWC2_37_7]